MLPVDFLGAVPQQAWVAARELSGLSELGARHRPLYSCSCVASPPTPQSSPPPETRLFQKAQPPFLCFTFNFVPKMKGGGEVSFSMPYFDKKKKKKKVCCHLTRRWGRRTLKRSHLLPQIIPPACRALEFQISGPQVRRPWK